LWIAYEQAHLYRVKLRLIHFGRLFAAFSIALLLLSRSVGQSQNPGFESGLDGWRPLWTREQNAGQLILDSQAAHSGHNSARVQHQSEKDWSLEPANRVPVEPGDVFESAAWVKVANAENAEATLCVATFDEDGHAIEWSYGASSISGSTDWRFLRSKFVIPEGVASIQPRLIGHGKASTWLDDFSLERKSSIDIAKGKSLRPVSIRNAALRVTLNPGNATFAVEDQRTHRRFEQRPLRNQVILLDASEAAERIDFRILHTASALEISGSIRLDGAKPEFTVELSSSGDLPAALQFPHPFTTASREYLVVPMNEGISYPIEDRTIEPMRLIAYGGHGICMAFWGVTDGTVGHAAIIETPDDAAIRIDRVQDRLVVAPEWESQKGAFAYKRKLRYIFFTEGGHVAIAKRYREYARQLGLLKTLAQKRAENPNVDLLIGAVNVWCWDKDAVGIAKEMQSAGIDRILWSNQQPPENIRALNEMGVLSGRYDIYQDVMNPANFPLLRWKHPDWTTAAWPQDIILNARGDWLRGWAIEGKDDKMHPCGVLCDRRAIDYARERIPADLQSHPYRARFIDTTTAAPWNECYSTNHPMTRSDSKRFKMELLRYVSEDNKLVTGCETGHDASVPYLHYFEGMMSLGPYRVPDAGRNMALIWTNAPEPVVKFQLGHNYRLPLWELVFHDCVVSQWYWGDYNNKLPGLWDKRDLFNVLYGSPPMFMFTGDSWRQNRARFVQSYKNTCPTVREVGYSEMIDHKFLTEDRSVQQTTFANGISVIVNFGNQPFRQPTGEPIAPLGFKVETSKRATKAASQ
jgi:hypothetical protein